MAIDKSMDARRVVPIGLSVEFRMILRNLVQCWQDGDRDDLENRLERLKDPDHVRRRIEAYERLSMALKRGKIELPDEEAREVLLEAQAGLEEEEEWQERKLIDETQRAMLAVFDSHHGGAAGDDENAATARSTSDGEVEERWTTRDDDLAMASAVLQRVLGAHPARLTVPELIRELAGEEPGFGASDAIERAARDLSGVGLIHLIEGLVSPTCAALGFEELIER